MNDAPVYMLVNLIIEDAKTATKMSGETRARLGE
jgi:hypothetical protein|tara:strand:- start:614 stop:715 length:102 start_codon:yes stop_codon:yes gene_type:complete